MTFLVSKTLCHCRITFNATTLCKVLNTFQSTSAFLHHPVSLFKRSKHFKAGKTLRNVPVWFSQNFCLMKILPRTNCCCKNFHSKGDDQFLKLLSDQIQSEKENMLKVPPPLNGWSLEQTGSSCLLTKDYNFRKSHSKINVTFNVNDSVSSANVEILDKPQVISQPDFAVEINKMSSSHVITFNCYFLEEFHEGVIADRLRSYGIRSVIVHDGEMEDSSYVIDVECVDMNLYQHMQLYLEERGITEVFTDEIMRIATAVENQEYISSLERLNSFVSSE